MKNISQLLLTMRTSIISVVLVLLGALYSTQSALSQQVLSQLRVYADHGDYADVDNPQCHVRQSAIRRIFGLNRATPIRVSRQAFCEENELKIPAEVTEDFSLEIQFEIQRCRHRLQFRHHRCRRKTRSAAYVFEKIGRGERI
jgi:hypothetical protein